jgi:hypothetical protein
LLFVTGLAALQVGIFNAQDHRPALLARKQPIKQGRARIAHMQLPSGRRREPRANFLIRHIYLNLTTEARGKAVFDPILRRA